MPRSARPPAPERADTELSTARLQTALFCRARRAAAPGCRCDVNFPACAPSAKDARAPPRALPLRPPSGPYPASRRLSPPLSPALRRAGPRAAGPAVTARLSWIVPRAPPARTRARPRPREDVCAPRSRGGGGALSRCGVRRGRSPEPWPRGPRPPGTRARGSAGAGRRRSGAAPGTARPCWRRRARPRGGAASSRWASAGPGGAGGPAGRWLQTARGLGRAGAGMTFPAAGEKLRRGAAIRAAEQEGAPAAAQDERPCSAVTLRGRGPGRRTSRGAQR